MQRKDDGRKWYGYAGHLCVGKRCAYHLATRIDGYLISTVGDWIDGGTVPREIGPEPDDLFESYVFLCRGEDCEGNPIIVNWEGVERRHYANSLSAELGHYELLEKYEAMIQGEVPNGAA